MTLAQAVQEQLIALIEDYNDLNTGPIAHLREPSPVEFAKQVSRGTACVYQCLDNHERNGFDEHHKCTESWLHKSCPALSWTKTSLPDLIRQNVEVAVTPHGRADALHAVGGQSEPVFLQPATIEMSMAEFLTKLSSNQSSPVYYLQSQDSNLTTHAALGPILQKQQVPRNIPFAAAVLGEPEAINIWIGDQHSVTSTHRDPYENLYLVVKGSKTFTLWPPVEEVCMNAKMVRTGKYAVNGDSFDVVMDEAGDGEETPRRIPWVNIDPDATDEANVEDHPLYAYASPRRVRVQEGEVLYLPSGWYHHVRQECGVWEDGSRAPCIAINYWYDMEYEGEKYAMRQLIGRLVGQVRDVKA